MKRKFFFTNKGNETTMFEDIIYEKTLIRHEKTIVEHSFFWKRPWPTNIIQNLWLTNIVHERTMVNNYQLWKNPGRTILGLKRQWLTEIGCEKTHGGPLFGIKGTLSTIIGFDNTMLEQYLVQNKNGQPNRPTMVDQSWVSRDHDWPMLAMKWQCKTHISYKRSVVDQNLKKKIDRQVTGSKGPLSNNIANAKTMMDQYSVWNQHNWPISDKKITTLTNVGLKRLW